MRRDFVRARLRALMMLSASVLVACGGESAGGRFKRYTVNGVAMIENPARLGAPPTFSLSDSVARDIGGLKERVDEEFNHRNGYLTGVTLSNGGLAVIDWTRVRLFDSAGTQTAVVGREGRGPGEFSGLTQMCRLPGDSVLVFDQTRRLTVVSPQGEIVRQSTVMELALTGAGCFDDGTVVTQAFARNMTTAVRDARAFRRRDDGTIVDSTGVFPTLSFAGVGQYMRLHPHGRSLYVSDPRKNEVRRFRLDGTLDQVVRMGDESRPMASGDAQRWLGGPVAAAGSGSAEDVRRDTGKPTWPFYRGIKIDGTGRLWVRDFPADDGAPDRWTVYDSDGVLVGSVEIPRGPPREIPNPLPGAPSTAPGFAPELVDAFGDFVILLERDPDGAAHFRTRRMR